MKKCISLMLVLLLFALPFAHATSSEDILDYRENASALVSLLGLGDGEELSTVSGGGDSMTVMQYTADGLDLQIDVSNDSILILTLSAGAETYTLADANIGMPADRACEALAAIAADPAFAEEDPYFESDDEGAYLELSFYSIYFTMENGVLSSIDMYML